MSGLDDDYLLQWSRQRQEAARNRVDRCLYCKAHAGTWHGTRCKYCTCPSSIPEHRK